MKYVEKLLEKISYMENKKEIVDRLFLKGFDFEFIYNKDKSLFDEHPYIVAKILHNKKIQLNYKKISSDILIELYILKNSFERMIMIDVLIGNKINDCELKNSLLSIEIKMNDINNIKYILNSFLYEEITSENLIGLANLGFFSCEKIIERLDQLNEECSYNLDEMIPLIEYLVQKNKIDLYSFLMNDIFLYDLSELLPIILNNSRHIQYSEDMCKLIYNNSRNTDDIITFIKNSKGGIKAIEDKWLNDKEATITDNINYKVDILLAKYSVNKKILTKLTNTKNITIKYIIYIKRKFKYNLLNNINNFNSSYHIKELISMLTLDELIKVKHLSIYKNKIKNYIDIAIEYKNIFINHKKNQLNYKINLLYKNNECAEFHSLFLNKVILLGYDSLLCKEYINIKSVIGGDLYNSSVIDYVYKNMKYYNPDFIWEIIYCNLDKDYNHDMMLKYFVKFHTINKNVNDSNYILCYYYFSRIGYKHIPIFKTRKEFSTNIILVENDNITLSNLNNVLFDLYNRYYLKHFDKDYNKFNLLNFEETISEINKYYLENDSDIRILDINNIESFKKIRYFTEKNIIDNFNVKKYSLLDLIELKKISLNDIKGNFIEEFINKKIGNKYKIISSEKEVDKLFKEYKRDLGKSLDERIEEKISLNRMQNILSEEKINKGDTVILRSPTGSGKSEALLLSIKNMVGNNISYCLPTISATNILYRNLVEKYNINAEINTSVLKDNNINIVNKLERHIKFFCPDNNMIDSMRTGYNTMGDIVIFDEYDSMPSDVKSVIIELQKRYKFTLVLISASINIENTKEKLEGNVKVFDFKNSINKIKHKPIIIDDIYDIRRNDIINIIKDYKSKKIGFIMNSIYRMNMMSDILFECGIPYLYLNSQTDHVTRLDIEEKLRKGNFDVILSNDTLSYSVDINFDVLVMDVSDKLKTNIQRLGRNNRYNHPVYYNNLILINDDSYGAPFIDDDKQDYCTELLSKVIYNNKINSMLDLLPQEELRPYDEIESDLNESIENNKSFSLRPIYLTAELPVVIDKLVKKGKENIYKKITSYKKFNIGNRYDIEYLDIGDTISINYNNYEVVNKNIRQNKINIKEI